MNILLGFAPFIAFAVVDRLLGSIEGLIAGAAVSAALLIRDFMSGNRKPKILEIGTMVLFGGLAIYALLASPNWSIMEVRLRVDGGLLLIVLISLAIRSPFTIQYAREQTPADVWDSPEFLRTNDVISGAWALAFAVMVIADLVLIYMPDVPQRVGIIATILAIVGAVKFTQWYPDRAQPKAVQ